MTPQGKHTPGPWAASPKGNIWAPNAKHLVLAKLDRLSGKLGKAEKAANAQLIAAAPELLEALQGCVSILSRCPSRDPNGEINGDMVPAIARAAIAKATGKAVQP